MIVGSSLCVEIGDRTLLRDASFVVGAGEKVGLVGRNGAGKSSFISVVVGEQSPQVRSTGHVAVPGHRRLPAPGPRRRAGWGSTPTASPTCCRAGASTCSTTPSTRRASRWPRTPRAENIELFSDLEEQYRENGGYEAESTMARLADGLGLPQDLLLEDIEGLSGGQRRRVDLIRILFQAPDTMILDEPTNHLDVAAKRWLMEELESFGGALLVISHDLELLDRAITKVLHLADGHLREFKGTYSSYRAQLAADTEQRERAATLEGREIKRLSTLADSMRGSTNRRARIAKSLDKRVERLEGQRTEVFARERKSTFRLPVPAAIGRGPHDRRHLAVRYGSDEVLRDVDFYMPGATASWSSVATGRGSRACCAAWPGCRRRPPARWPWGPTSPSATSPRSTSRWTPTVTALANVDDTVLKAEERAPGPAGLLRPALQGGRPDARLPLGRRAGQAGPGHAGRRPGQPAVLDEPTNNLDPASIDAVGGCCAAGPAPWWW